MVTLSQSFLSMIQATSSLTKAKAEKKLLDTLRESEETFKLLERKVEIKDGHTDTLAGLVTFLRFQKKVLDKHSPALEKIHADWKASGHKQAHHLQAFLQRKNMFFEPRSKRELPSKESVFVRAPKGNGKHSVYVWDDLSIIDSPKYMDACIMPRLFILTQIKMLQDLREHLYVSY